MQLMSLKAHQDTAQRAVKRLLLNEKINKQKEIHAAKFDAKIRDLQRQQQLLNQVDQAYAQIGGGLGSNILSNITSACGGGMKSQL